ncbi:amino acid ABC transporter ATP-binding protein [Gemelliphila palaticanis]|uniref:Amino acid ABC transporter ATP-binding protein n=1 Tax=Gemelliphila palaticanis TaxID=81950 RepID=A0ABX2T0J3_9BACL|nr:ATP-binding cassette domain-containing protein [Gemella palaticanis]MBF0716130.1 amino acid ABC transporter ATP-binding protein [Gemella palaticanis]NYS48060.1 amino acid ABC transporter ATP-binding protein [Gemella palaticanis]
MLKVENIYKTINNNEILKGVSLHVEEGDIIGLIGKSGSGKSTVLRSIAGISGVDKGKIIYKNKVISDTIDFAVRDSQALEIGMVFQQFNLFNHWTVLENIYKNLTLIKNISKDQAIIEAKKSLDNVGLVDFYDRKISSLSGGQKQRVAIARTLAMKNKLILFDEATSALDPESSKDIMTLMQKLKSKHNVTMIIVSHELDFIKNICNKVYYMENGEVIESGNSVDIFENPRTNRLKNFLGLKF